MISYRCRRFLEDSTDSTCLKIMSASTRGSHKMYDIFLSWYEQYLESNLINVCLKKLESIKK